MKPETSRLFQGVKDILIIYISCFLLLMLVGVGDEENRLLHFGGPTTSPTLKNQQLPKPSSKNLAGKPPRAQTRTQPRKSSTIKKNQHEIKNEAFHHRTYEWSDLLKRERKTVFRIPTGLFKSELRKFGSPPAMSHPLFMEKKGFKVIGRRSYIKNHRIRERVYTIVDYQAVYNWNLPHFPPLTETLTQSSVLTEGTDPLPTFLTFVQQIRYRKPPEVYKGRYIGEFFPPLVCLYEQYGDCDSKTVLLANFLGTTPNSTEKLGVVLVRGRGLSHALLGVKRKVLPGMTALFLKGKGFYIVLETTRPRWAPGFIDRRITDAIKSGYFQFVTLN